MKEGPLPDLGGGPVRYTRLAWLAEGSPVRTVIEALIDPTDDFEAHDGLERTRSGPCGGFEGM